MAQTLAEKIVARAAGRATVEAGEYVDVTPDYTVCQEISWAARKAIMETAGVTRLARPERVIMVVDHTTSAAMGTPYKRSHREMRDFAARHGAQFHGAGAGLRHLVLTEKGLARPGLLIFSDEPNIASIGVVGALNVAVSSEVVITQALEDNWMAVPRSARITLTGALPGGVGVRDLAQAIIRDYAQTDTLSQCCIEYAGPGLAGLSLDDRQSLLACSYHAGADTAITAPDAVALAYAEARGAGRPVGPLAGDADARFAVEAAYDLSSLSPLVTVPPELHGAVPVGDVAGLRIDQACVGSCANNRLDDLRATAAILRGRRVAPHVTLYVTPGSPEVVAAAAREGLLETLADAGAVVLAPGCTTCWGYEGVLEAGEVSISTHQMNYHGRNGSREARAYLAGPAVVAASALAGRIADPREVA